MTRFDFRRLLQTSGAPAADDPPETREILTILPHERAANFVDFVRECWPTYVHTEARTATHALIVVGDFGLTATPFSTAKHVERYLMETDAIYVTQQPGVV